MPQAFSAARMSSRALAKERSLSRNAVSIAGIRSGISRSRESTGSHAIPEPKVPDGDAFIQALARTEFKARAIVPIDVNEIGNIGPDNAPGAKMHPRITGSRR